QDVLSQLESETASFQEKHEDKDVCIIWALHFPPVYPQITSGMKLIDDEAVRRSANENGVSAILSGHTHNPFEFSSPRIRFRVLCAGTATQSNSPQGNYCQLMSISNLEQGCAFSVTHYSFNEKWAKFVRV